MTSPSCTRSPSWLIAVSVPMHRARGLIPGRWIRRFSVDAIRIRPFRGTKNSKKPQLRVGFRCRKHAVCVLGHALADRFELALDSLGVQSQGKCNVYRPLSAHAPLQNFPLNGREITLTVCHGLNPTCASWLPARSPSQAAQTAAWPPPRRAQTPRSDAPASHSGRTHAPGGHSWCR